MKLAIAMLVGSLLAMGAVAVADELKVGDQAPDFKMVGSDGKSYSLSELNKQGKAVVIAWFTAGRHPRLHQGMHFIQN